MNAFSQSPRNSLVSSPLSRLNPGILIVDDEFLIRYSLQSLLQEAGFNVDTAATGAEALERLKKQKPYAVILDIRLPDMNGLAVLEKIRSLDPSIKVIMITASPDIPSSVEAMKMGAIDYFEKPIDLEKLKSALRAAQETGAAGQARRLPGNFVFKSTVMKDIYRVAERLANKSDVTMLVLGESGTGKSYLCKTLHEMSSRKDKPFIEIGCSSIPEHLIESELFGYEKGSFTDAKVTKKGLVEVAEGGTVFLDEIGDMPYAMQSKLLDLIEERKFRRIGGLQSINADIRIFAATNRNLYELVQEQKFRLDLYYRLNVVTIEMPPLRERREDIPLLVKHYLTCCSEKHRCGNKGITNRALNALQNHSWTGNIRELKNLLEKLVILAKNDEIDVDDLPAPFLEERAPAEPPRNEPPSFCMSETRGQGTLSLKALEEEHIRTALRRAEGNQRKAAKLLDITRDTLRYRLKKLGIDSSQYTE
jgi:DNA-binding NtrC family response regulator